MEDQHQGQQHEHVNDPVPGHEHTSKKNRHKKESAGRITELEHKNKELNDKYLRIYAEFDNYRKRTQREKTEFINQASSEIIFSLLPVLDDLDRAIKSAVPETAADATLDGIILITNKFRNILSMRGLESMQSIGEPFNTDFHEAVTNIPAPVETMKGKVIDEIQKGYLLNGKVLRFAKVVVGT